VDDYTTEFYKLVACVDLAESDDQLVSRYIGGMRQQFLDSSNFFDPLNVSEAHQGALHLENTLSRKPLGLIGGGGSGGSNDLIPHPLHVV
jgi:hypothetical protein